MGAATSSSTSRDKGARRALHGGGAVTLQQMREVFITCGLIDGGDVMPPQRRGTRMMKAAPPPAAAARDVPKPLGGGTATWPTTRAALLNKGYRPANVDNVLIQPDELRVNIASNRWERPVRLILHKDRTADVFVERRAEEAPTRVLHVSQVLHVTVTTSQSADNRMVLGNAIVLSRPRAANGTFRYVLALPIGVYQLTTAQALLRVIANEDGYTLLLVFKSSIVELQAGWREHGMRLVEWGSTKLERATSIKSWKFRAVKAKLDGSDVVDVIERLDATSAEVPMQAAEKAAFDAQRRAAAAAAAAAAAGAADTDDDDVAVPRPRGGSGVRWPTTVAALVQRVKMTQEDAEAVLPAPRTIVPFAYHPSEQRFRVVLNKDVFSVFTHDDATGGALRKCIMRDMPFHHVTVTAPEKMWGGSVLFGCESTRGKFYYVLVKHSALWVMRLPQPILAIRDGFEGALLDTDDFVYWCNDSSGTTGRMAMVQAPAAPRASYNAMVGDATVGWHESDLEIWRALDWHTEAV